LIDSEELGSDAEAEEEDTVKKVFELAEKKRSEK
jgi:hypothetical protein